MKRFLASLFIFFLFAFFNTTHCFAVTTNATDSGQKSTPTPQKKLIDKQIQNLKDKIATTVAELSKSNQRVITGLVSNYNETTLILQRPVKTKINIDSEITEFIDGDNTKKTLSLEDLNKNDHLTIFGLLLGNELTAKKIIKQSQLEFIEGTVKNVEKGSYFIEIITQDQETITVDIEKNTIQKKIDEETLEISDAGFSNYTIGARMHCVLIKRKSGVNRGSAVRTLIVPQLLIDM